MAKELMEIGGFITEGAEIVNHDNTLSGNGTVDSPLGLNETVLWEGTCDYPGTLTVSEPVSAFDRYRIYLRNTERQQQTVVEKYANPSNSGNNNRWVTLDCFQAGGVNSFFTINCGKGEWNSDYNEFSYNGGYAAWMDGSCKWYSIGTTGNVPQIQKIVGINRKAQ